MVLSTFPYGDICRQKEGEKVHAPLEIGVPRAQMCL